ncbi:MAG TPA: carbohydrate porin [Mucilaginibacter sp.]|jgi:high affinity Mn2+ porin|nr:carbohydrate porin [Mucilaginibacter sp.]
MKKHLLFLLSLLTILKICVAQDTSKNQRFNLHFQNTYVVQGDPGFSAKYSGPNSLNRAGERQETATANLFAGARLWRGAEAHMDFLMWQGFGLSQTYGIEAFPNGDAYKAGTKNPNFSFARLFIRQTIGLGGEQEDVPDDQLTLAGKQDIPRLTFTIGRLSPLDICDNNTYAHDQHTQFLNWAMMGNLTWDYGQNTIGYTTGVAVELNQPKWSLRYGFFQMPRDKNGFTGDDQFLMWPHRGAYGPFFRAWAMMAEFERRYIVNAHPGAIRFLTWLDEANFASYQVATAILLANPPDPNIGQGSGVTIPGAARGFRHKYGFGLNWEQEVSKNVGLFSRLGWTDGHNDTWTFTDADWSASMGISVKGSAWHRRGDTFGLAIIISGASRDNQQFLKAGGTDMLSGDGTLNYSPEKALETYYDFQIWKTVHATLDYQFVTNPAFNRDRGPVNVFGIRAHVAF